LRVFEAAARLGGYLGDAYARQSFDLIVSIRACASVGVQACFWRQTQTAASATVDDHITPVRLTERPTT
jgi:hypothetical protein